MKVLDLISVSSDDVKIIKLCDYLVENYIDEGEKFDPRICNTGTYCTTNSCVFPLKIKFSIYESSFQYFHIYTFFKYKIQTESYIGT